MLFFLVLQSGNVPSSLGVDKAEKKLQENEELMKRLTGIWEDKWSKTQKLIEVKWSLFYLKSCRNPVSVNDLSFCKLPTLCKRSACLRDGLNGSSAKLFNKAKKEYN